MIGGLKNRASPYLSGFTLVEMLVALAIFGMITAAGVGLLSVSARTQATSDRLLAELGELRRVDALLTADLAQAASRRYRDRDGRPTRAFTGRGGGEPMLLMFVRRGWDRGAMGDAAVQRVGYRLEGGRLERLAFAQVDGGNDGIAVTLLDDVRALRLRYRDDRGDWREVWDEGDPLRLPVAVELITDSERHGMVRQLFVVGTGR